MRLPQKVFFNGLGALAGIVTGVARNKIFAAFLSLEVFGIFSIGQQSVSLLVTVTALGIPLAFTTLAAEYSASPSEVRRRALTQMVLLAGLVSAAVAVGLAAVMGTRAREVAAAVTGGDAYTRMLTIMVFSGPLLVFHLSMLALMEGIGHLRGIVWYKTAPPLLALPLVYALVRRSGLTGAAIGTVAGDFLLAAAALWLLRRELGWERSAWALRPMAGRVVRLAALSFAGGLAFLGMDFAVKRLGLAYLGEAGNGIVQSVTKITDLYPFVALAWLNMHLFPALAAAPGDRARAARIIERTVLVAMVLMAPMVIGLFLLRPELLELLYRGSFRAGAGFFGAMLATGLVKVFASSLTIALLPLGLRREWLAASLLMPVTYGLLAWTGLRAGWGMNGIALAYGAGFLVQAAGALVALHRGGLRFRRSFWGEAMMFGLGTLGVVAALVHPWAISIAVLVLVLVSWRAGLAGDLRRLARFPKDVE